MILNKQSGQSLAEYALILALIAITVIALTTRMGLQVACSLAWTAGTIENSISPTTLNANNWMAANCAVLGRPYDLL